MQDTEWIDRAEYPFAPHWFATEHGRMHYLDEGQGSPVVMVHGTPAWSFLYRHLIKGLSPKHRCVAADHLGFGLSDKPAGSAFSYRPQDHARNLGALLNSLGLDNITLVVHDFGGPIGLSYALEHPERVKRLVIVNTWMWSLRGDPHFARPGKLFGGGLGRFLYEKFNFAVAVMLKKAARGKLTDTAWRHYQKPMRDIAARYAAWVMARELIGSSDWYEGLIRQKEKIEVKPALVLWGLDDFAFPKKLMQNWSLLLRKAEIQSFPDAGHLVLEEKGTELAGLIEKFIQGNP
jgi:haloalkane dehalogenase